MSDNCRSRAIKLVWDDVDDMVYPPLAAISERISGQVSIGSGGNDGGQVQRFNALSGMLSSISDALSEVLNTKARRLW